MHFDFLYYNEVKKLIKGVITLHKLWRFKGYKVYKNTMSIITDKKENNNNLEKLNTLITLKIFGDGEEILDYNLPTPHKYTRYTNNLYLLEYLIKGVFWTSKSVNFLNEILLRFNLSMKIQEIQSFTVGEKSNPYELKLFSSSSNLLSIKKERFNPNHNKYEDSVFWGLKLFVEHNIKDDGFIAYSTLENFAFTHYIDYTKDNSTLRAKCRSIWNYYDSRDWKPTEYIKKNKEETQMTREEHIKVLAKKRVKETEERITAAINFLKENDRKINIKNISDFTKIHRNTVSKYKHLWS